jgi:hypothetical protein
MAVKEVCRLTVRWVLLPMGLTLAGGGVRLIDGIKCEGFRGVAYTGNVPYVGGEMGQQLQLT